MEYLTIFNILFWIALYILFRFRESNIRVQEEILKVKDHLLLEHVEEHNKFIETFDGFYKNKTYQIGMGFLYLKKYQTELAEILDPVLDMEMILKLKGSFGEIDDLLKELAFMSQQTIKHQKGKIITPIYFDDTMFSKN